MSVAGARHRMVSSEGLEEVKQVCPLAEEMSEAGLVYLVLPNLKLPDGQIIDALLCLQPRDGYPTRLFVSARTSKALNWTCHRILDRDWHTWSWTGVAPSLRPIEILIGHLGALR